MEEMGAAEEQALLKANGGGTLLCGCRMVYDATWPYGPGVIKKLVPRRTFDCETADCFAAEAGIA